MHKPGYTTPISSASFIAITFRTHVHSFNQCLPQVTLLSSGCPANHQCLQLVLYMSFISIDLLNNRCHMQAIGKNVPFVWWEPGGNPFVWWEFMQVRNPWKGFNI